MKKNRIIVALDVQNLNQAKTLVDELCEVIQYFKVGSELFTSCGPEIISYIHKQKSRVFLDLKFHDIPNTVAQAVKAAADLGVFMCNVHALGGRVMMQEAAKSIKKRKKKPHLLAVTVLTSMKEDDLKDVGIFEKPDDQVLDLAHLAKASGMDGVVCSGREAEVIRKMLGKKFLIVTPGIRPRWAAKGDQKRIVTPKEAFLKGADFIVVGRPITQAKNPLEAAKRILRES